VQTFSTFPRFIALPAEFLSGSRSKVVVAEGIRDAFSDLFAINKQAQTLTPADAKNKLRTLFAGRKTDLVIGHIAKTFKGLCDYADFSAIPSLQAQAGGPTTVDTAKADSVPQNNRSEETSTTSGRIKVGALQYHINIVLPDTRDQAVYDAIFRSLRDHLG
jgi:hypothetical protein